MAEPVGLVVVKVHVKTTWHEKCNKREITRYTDLGHEREKRPFNNSLLSRQTTSPYGSTTGTPDVVRGDT